MCVHSDAPAADDLWLISCCDSDSSYFYNKSYAKFNLEQVQWKSWHRYKDYTHTLMHVSTHISSLMFGGIILSIIMLFCLFSICLSIYPSIHPLFYHSIMHSVVCSISHFIHPSSFQSCSTFYLYNTATCKRRYFEKLYLFFHMNINEL